MSTKYSAKSAQSVENTNESETPPPKRRRGVILKSAFDVRRLLNKIINEIRNEEVTTDIARCQAYLCQILLKSMEQSELEERLTALEDKILNKFK